MENQLSRTHMIFENFPYQPEKEGIYYLFKIPEHNIGPNRKYAFVYLHFCNSTILKSRQNVIQF